LSETPGGASHDGGPPGSEPGQDHPALEDRQPSADQDGVSIADVESEQLEQADDAEQAGVHEYGAEQTAAHEDTAEPTQPTEHLSALDVEGLLEPDPAIVRTVEALLFLSPDPLSPQELADAAAVEELAAIAALAELAERYAPGHSGIHLRELGGGFTFASDPLCEESARRLFSRPRASVLSPAQAETLAIVAYLQPVSRPEITRIRGVSADSAASTLLERGLLEESGRSQFGAVLYRTTTQFLKLFGLKSIDELPDVAQWDPTPEEQAELRDRLLRAGEARVGGGAQSELQ
jgi:segregation and condensation protein B